MKKKYLVPSKDKKDWINFKKQMGQIRSKEVDDYKENLNSSKINYHIMLFLAICLSVGAFMVYRIKRKN